MTLTKEQFEIVLNDIKKNNSLYVKILRMGQTFIDTGISYNSLKSLLEKDGYDFSNNCIEIAVKQWFFDSFHHKGVDGKLVSIEDLENHLNCNFILKGDAGLKLADHDTSKMNLNIARKAMIISIIVLCATILQPIMAKFFSDDKNVSDAKNKDITIIRDTIYIDKASKQKGIDTIVNINHNYNYKDNKK